MQKGPKISEGRTADIFTWGEEQILKLYKQELRKYAADFQDYERPKRFHLLTEEWTVDNNLITPTLKLKRNRVEERFQEELAGMY